MSKSSIPEVGKEYYFFDDGKSSLSRIYKAKVLRVVPYNEKVSVIAYDFFTDGPQLTPIQKIHKREVDSHRQTDNFKVIKPGVDTKTGTPYLYAEETDFFIECEIPKYDRNTIWFARTVSGGWFSMDIQSSWQSGLLDVDFSKYNSIKSEWIKNSYKYLGFEDFDAELKEMGVFIENI